MSEIMRGVLCMPPSMWTNDPIEIAQRYGIYKAAAKELDRLQSSLDEANDRFHRMNTPTGREIELQHAIDCVVRVSKSVEIDGEQWIAIPRAAWMAAAKAM